MRIGKLLELWRTHHLLTAKAAAAKIGITPSTLRRIERGESMHADTLKTVLVWLLEKEEPSPNAAFKFEAEEAAPVEEADKATPPYIFHPDRQEDPSTPEPERNAYTFGGEEAGAGESSSNTCELGGGNDASEPPIVASPGITASCITVDGNRFEFERRQHSEPEGPANAPGAAIEEEPETAAQYPVHAVDQNAAVWDLREERGGGSSHGTAGAGPEGSG